MNNKNILFLMFLMFSGTVKPDFREDWDEILIKSKSFNVQSKYSNDSLLLDLKLKLKDEIYFESNCEQFSFELNKDILNGEPDLSSLDVFMSTDNNVVETDDLISFERTKFISIKFDSYIYSSKIKNKLTLSSSSKENIAQYEFYEDGSNSRKLINVNYECKNKPI